MREWIEWSSQGIQALAVVIIAISIIFGSLRFLVQLSKRSEDAYRAYKQLLGRSLLLALEFLVAADVIRTVLLDLTAKGMEILGALVVVRTFLSWSLVVELEGHWPWRSSEIAAQGELLNKDDSRQSVYASTGELDQPAPWAVRVPVPPAASDDVISFSPQRTETKP
ncbi:MAG: DUF1622 domain-containing protein [Candidatus Angelobacter sp.]